MNTLPLQWIIVAGVVAVALLALAAWFFFQKKKQSTRLQQRFGPEYTRTIDELGGRTKAEAELKAREKRVEDLTITPLAPAEAARFSQAWNAGRNSGRKRRSNSCASFCCPRELAFIHSTTVGGKVDEFD